MLCIQSWCHLCMFWWASASFHWQQFASLQHPCTATDALSLHTRTVTARRLSSRLAPSSPSAAAGDASADSTGGSCGSRSAVASSRNKGQPDKPYVPIWERLLPPTALAEEKKVAATAQRVLQPVALKTFSPTLGSLGGGLAQQGALAPACFTYWPFASTSFMPFRLLHHMRRHGTLSAQVHAWQGCLGCF